jgi:indolepyruvate ferredoxin oxidoreductase beta subunit
VARGEADLIISLELLEALRVAHFANRKTKFIVNESKIKPTSVYFGGYSYPSVDEIKEKLEKVCDVFFVPASERVKEFGEVYSNAFLLGFARSFLPIDERAIMAAMRKLPNFEINKRVYELAKSF